MNRQDNLFDNQEPKAGNQKPLECLGKTFDSGEARREHFLRLLREGLEELHTKLGGVPFTTVEDAVQRMKSVEKWPMGDDARLHELAERMRHADSSKDLLQRWKDVVGFPNGEIEDILNLSDPPYYTACPNPFIADFIKHYGKPYDPNVPYSKEPFAADVSEGKNDPIYNAHSYHTKVPHKAIMRYILHYTEPGDVVFDGFCGTGMTGVAAQLCGDRKTVESLGYKVDDQGIIYQQEEETDESGKKRTVWKPFSRLGARRAVLNDLSPAATFIAYNYNTPVDVQAFEREAKRILKEVEEECGWMYETFHSDGKTKGRINYTVWSEVFTCNACAGELVFTHIAFDAKKKKVRSEFPCPHCGATLKKDDLDLVYESLFDTSIGKTVRRPKRVPVLINYTVGKIRYEKEPDRTDLDIIRRIEAMPQPVEVPALAIPDMQMMRVGRMRPSAITHLHHFFLPRARHALAALWKNANRATDKRVREMLLFFVDQAIWGMSVLNRYSPSHFSQVNRALSGVFYVASHISEVSPWYILEGKLKRLMRAFAGTSTAQPHTSITTEDLGRLEVPSRSVDYIFTDPPFGENIYYSDLNLLVESWYGVTTRPEPEAIVDRVRDKSLLDYQVLMEKCFRRYFDALKPGRWMTVEFHNSRNSVWSSIQEALQRAGFVVADVRTLDKKQGSFQQVTSGGAVKQDLVISAYKPNGGLEDRFKLTAGTEEGVWDYIRTHLGKLAPPTIKSGSMEINPERMNYLLFDRMVAFHVQRGVTVPLSAAEFYAGLAQRFPERDGMYFLPEQVAEYDKKRMKVKEVLELQLFVTDEASAIQWLKQQLTRKPQTFQELHPQFLKEIGGWQKHEKPLELSELLEQNFLRYDGKGEVPSQIHSYLSSNFKELRNLPKDDERLRAKAKDRWYVPDPNKAGDLEKLRERALLREFEEYRESKQKRLKVFRLEAVRAGFKKAWQERDYATIIAVARKIPENVLQEDPKLLMWYDQALTRMGDE
ncbi:DNA methyltransferase [Rubrobacter naiadicus]|uniref:DNA methyltransferase n=1 Tax=Rubrobacter naiadicus TaxID=1392641 RepID=UPI00235F452A|nr:DNA methyltransferase [Rubrobacter naiadicus]